MPAERELAGKIALVTGGARGIGRAIGLALAEAGATVIVADVAEPEHRDLPFRRLDVCDYETVQETIKTVAAEHGGLHVLVNNAGVTADQVLGRMKPADWRRVMAVNLDGAFHCARAAARIMIKQREGRIISLASIIGRIGRIGQANYAASKAGLEGLTRALALELAHRGVTVNAVAPGFIESEMTRALPAAVRDEILKGIPLRRAGAPEEVAELVRFLAGPRASYITGQTIHINGGLYFG